MSVYYQIVNVVVHTSDSGSLSNGFWGALSRVISKLRPKPFHKPQEKVFSFDIQEVKNDRPFASNDDFFFLKKNGSAGFKQ